MNTLSNLSFTVEALLSQGSWAERLAHRLVSPGQDSEDLVQEGWIAALRARPEINDGLRPWLARVLRNTAANLKRTHGRWQAREEVVGDRILSMAVPSPEEVVGRMEIQRLLTDAVLALDPPLRDVVLLRFYQGLTSAEIARSQGIPEGTIRRRLKTGLDELRTRLDKDFKGEREDWMRGLGPLITSTGSGRPGNAQVVAAGMHGARNMHLTWAAFIGVVLLAGVGYWAFTLVGGAGAPERTEQADRFVGNTGHTNSGSGTTMQPGRTSSPLTFAAVSLGNWKKELQVVGGIHRLSSTKLSPMGPPMGPTS